MKLVSCISAGPKLVKVWFNRGRYEIETVYVNGLRTVRYMNGSEAEAIDFAELLRGVPHE